MTMDFHVKDAALLRTLRPGQGIGFEFVAEPGGDYAIVRVQPAAGTQPAGAAKSPSSPASPPPAHEPKPAASGSAAIDQSKH
jgi:hypothetical protein